MGDRRQGARPRDRRARPALDHRGRAARRHVRAALAPRRDQVRDHEGVHRAGHPPDARHERRHVRRRRARRGRRAVGVADRFTNLRVPGGGAVVARRRLLTGRIRADIRPESGLMFWERPVSKTRRVQYMARGWKRSALLLGGIALLGAVLAATAAAGTRAKTVNVAFIYPKTGGLAAFGQEELDGVRRRARPHGRPVRRLTRSTRRSSTTPPTRRRRSPPSRARSARA